MCPPRTLAFLLLVLLSTVARAAEIPAGIEAALDALAAVHAPSEVALSPDGSQLVYGRTVTGKRAGADVDISALYLARARDGGGEVRLTACPGTACDEHGAAWSPDGRTLVFVTTDAHEQPQLAVADDRGGNVRVLTHAQGPLDVPRWSPDGRQLAFLYSAGAPRTPGPLNPLARDAGVLSQQIYEQRLAVLPATGGEPRLLGPQDVNIYEYDWSPDGARFVVSYAHGSGDDNWWIAALGLIDARSGQLSPLWKPPVTLQIASPRFASDGGRVAFIGGLMSDETITGGDAYVLSLDGAEPVDVTPGLRASVQTLTWNGSSRELIATEFQAGEEVLAAIDVAHGTQRTLWHGPQMIWANNVLGLTPGDVGVSLSRDGRTAATILQSYTQAPEVYAGPPGRWHAVTRLNAAVQPMTGPAHILTWQSDELSVQGMLIEPPHVTAGQRYPLVVEVHGGPAYAHYPLFPASPDAYDAVLAARGYYVFKPNPRGSYGQGEAFTRANVRDFGYGDLRDILRGLDAVLARASIDARRVGITGWSYGGYMTMWALTQTDRFHAGVAGAGLSDWLSYYGTNNIDTWMIPYFGASVYDDPKVYERSSPLTFIKQVHAPTLLLGGDRDAEVPLSQSYEYWNGLRRHGVPTEFVVYPDEGHFFFKRADQADVMARIVGWFDRYLGAD
ncbi:MAG: S9 family peptidase [Gammaproteobacteria bacterium]|nr:S9 family peptidase [Gammaproteobacteria bacterium]MBV9620029.1 S9 family peptidase [Gammaproteobacteria bacterium]